MTDSAAAAAVATPNAVFVDIDRSSNNCLSCNVKEGFVSETKPSELSSVPNFLWDELGDALNPILRKYNSIRLAVTSTAFFVFVVLFILISTNKQLEEEKDYDDRTKDFDYDYDYDDDFDIYDYDYDDDIYDDSYDSYDTDIDNNLIRTTDAYVFLVFFLMMGYVGSVIGLQLRKTHCIQEIVSKFRPRFASNGVHIRFETDAGPCRNRRQPEVRRLVFTPATTAATTATANTTTTATATTTTTTPTPGVADVESPSPQFSSAPVCTTAAC